MRIVVINRCQDCPIEGCEHRQIAGTIPKQCPLPEKLEPKTTNKENK